VLAAHEEGDPTRPRSLLATRLASSVCFTVTILLAPGCRHKSDHTSRERVIRLLPDQGTASRREPRPLVIPTPGECVPLRTVAVRLTGQMQEIHKFGPPGFGETPKEDVRLTIVLLRVTEPLDTCAGTFGDASQSALKGLSEIQLDGLDPSLAKVALGAIVDVYGWLDPGTSSNDFTKIVLWVDSIPALKHPDNLHAPASHLSATKQGQRPNQRMKLSGRGGRPCRTKSVLMAAAAPRSLCASR
jgi:hypothetical protein